jgi:hypothetical protein
MNNDYNNQQPQQPQYQPPMPPVQPGKNLAVASLIMGICSLVFWWMSYGAIIGIGLGIAAAICGTKAKKQGFIGGMATAGVVTGIIGAVLCAIGFIVCTVIICAAVGVAGMADTWSSLYY